MRPNLAGAAFGLALSGALLPAGGALAADVAVTVERVANARGSILVAICTAETFLGAECPWRAAVAARPGAVTIVLQGVPPGRYALQAFHDENGNGDLDRGGVLRFPSEAWGFGNDAEPRFGPPQFDAAAVDVATGTTVARLRLIYPGERR